MSLLAVRAEKEPAAQTPQLHSMLSTAELEQRPSHPPDYEAENRALIALARELAMSPDSILQKLADTALTLCRAHSAGLSLLEDEDQRQNFHWRAIAGRWAEHVGGGTPRDFGPCGTVLDRNMALLCTHPERDFPYFADVTPGVEEALLIPFHVRGEAVGTIWVVAHDASRRFDRQDLRVMTNLSNFAAAAYQSTEADNALQRIAAIVDSSDDAIISKDLNGIITSWNKGAERVFGYTSDEAVGKPVTILIPPERHDEEPAILERVRRGERIEHYETVRMRKHGSRIDISLTVSPVKNAVGKIIGASKIARDITERKRADEIAQRLAALVESSDDAIISKDLNGIIRSWNKGAQQLFGYLAEEIVGKPVTTLIPPELQHEEPAILARVRRGERIDHYETVRIRKDGSRLDISLTVSPIRDAASNVIGASKIARNITERKRSEQQITILAREAEHRAKNVLATVQATVHLSHADTPDGLKHVIEGRIQALANVHRLFVETRWTGANLRNLVKEELAGYRQDGERRVRLNGPDIVLEPSAAQAIAVSLHELATNAAKYGALSEPNGRVDVAWSRTPDGIALSWTETGGPPAKPPTRQGFGTRVMDAMIKGQMKGELRFEWRAEGLACEIAMPVSATEPLI
jgi:PAS domain S-box-containing protein